MHAQLEELWIDAMEMKVGEQITTYLRKNHPEYQEIEARQKKLIEDYPMLWKVVDGDGTVTLNEKEHCALKEYLSNQDDMERLMRERGLSPAEAAREALRQDRERARLYGLHTGAKWGEVGRYDLTVDSGPLGVSGTVELLSQFIALKTMRRRSKEAAHAGTTD